MQTTGRPHGIEHYCYLSYNIHFALAFALLFQGVDVEEDGHHENFVSLHSEVRSCWNGSLSGAEHFDPGADDHGSDA